MTRELGPEGIHIGHVVIDGAIDTVWIRELFPETSAKKDQDGITNPDEISGSTGNSTCRNGLPGILRWTSDPGWSNSKSLL